MANIGIDALKDKIDEKIVTNGEQEITAAVLNDVLQDSVDTLAENVSVSQNTLNIGGNYAGEMSTTYDVTLHNDDATFASLEALLSDANLDTLIPLAVRKGGMSIKFVQSSDNKYIQCHCLSENFSTDVDDWFCEYLDILDLENTVGKQFIIPTGERGYRTIVDNQWINTSGSANADMAYFIAMADYQNMELFINPSETTRMAFLNAAPTLGNYVSYCNGYGWDLISSEKTFNVPSDCRYLVLYAGKDNATITYNLSVSSGLHEDIFNIQKDINGIKKWEDNYGDKGYAENTQIPSNDLNNSFINANGELVSGVYTYSIFKISSEDTVVIKASGTTNFALLKDSTFEIGTPLNYASGYTTAKYINEGKYIIEIPADANYIAIAKNDANTILLDSVCKVLPSYISSGIPFEKVEFVNGDLFNNSGVLRLAVTSSAVTPHDNFPSIVSKDIYQPIGRTIHYKVSSGYKIDIYPYAGNYKFVKNVLIGENLTGEGTVNIIFPYFRIFVKKADGSIIKPTDDFSVEISGAVKPYKNLYPYFYIAAEDSSQYDKDHADFVCGHDARYAIQLAMDIAYVSGTYLVMASGNYVIRTYLNDYTTGGMVFGISHQLSNTQYTSPVQGRTIEGLRKPCSWDVNSDCAKIIISDELYNSTVNQANIFNFLDLYRQDWTTYFMTSFLKLKNFVISIPNNQKPITAINLSGCEGGSWLESLRIVSIPYIQTPVTAQNIPQIGNVGCIGIISNPNATWNTNSQWNDIEIQGFNIGVKFIGMEHALVRNLTVQWCNYGMDFTDGSSQHPITLIDVQDEHNVHLPNFGNKEASIVIMGYNASWPEKAPSMFDTTSEGWSDRKRAQGNPRGTIEFTNNIQPDGTITSAVDYPSFFEYGQGLKCKCRNMHHVPSGTTAIRTASTFAPNYLQEFYDTTLNKMLWCIDTENKTWVDANGSIV